jgi:hypothetical protein
MCKKKSAASCLSSQWSDYETSVTPFLKIARSKKSTQQQKRQASEQIGSLAAKAYNAKRHKITLAQSDQQHEEFHGSGVPDMTMQVGKNLEVKEAKGGKSGYGECMDISGKKKVKQCTPKYMKVIAHKMAHSKYNGNHPKGGCTHNAGKKKPCLACRKRERTRQQGVGKKMQKGISKRTILKVAIRGHYTKLCLREPKVIEAYNLDNTGNKQMVTV